MLRSIVIIVVSVSVLCVVWFNRMTVAEDEIKATSHLRQLRIDQQVVEQHVHTLGKGQTHPLMQVLGEDVTHLQVRLAQYLSDETADEGVIVAYEQSLLGQGFTVSELSDVSVSSDIEILILRLDVQANVAHAPELLALLRRLSASTDGWPVDVRACSIQRLPSQQLATQCVVDIYFWEAGLS